MKSTLHLAVDILRMIKIFGWEKKILERIDRARKSELAALLKFKVCLQLDSSWLRAGMINLEPDINVMEPNDKVYHIFWKMQRSVLTLNLWQ